MMTMGRMTIWGGGLGLYLVGVALLGATILNQHDDTLRRLRSHLADRDLRAPAGREPNDAPWSGAIRQVDEALAQQKVREAEGAWLDAFVAALKSGRWEGMVEVGDGYVRLGQLSEIPRASVEAKAHRMYQAALFRARQQGSLDGVLRTAEAFAAIGARDGVEQSVRIAEVLAANGRDAQATGRVRALRERLETRALDGQSPDFDPLRPSRW